MAIDISSVRAGSGVAKSAAAYNDRVKHGYNLNYLHPKLRSIGFQSSRLPKDTAAWEWRIIQRKTGRLFHKDHKVTSPSTLPSRARVNFNLPLTGIYDCQFIITLGNGRQQKSPVRSINLRDLLIVVIGDSAASGEGNPDEAGKALEFGDNIDGWDKLNPFAWVGSAIDATANWFKKNFTTISAMVKAELDMDPAPRWLEKSAHRSLRSGAAKAARHLERPPGVRKPINQGDVVTVTFLHFARSGSDIKNGLLGPRTKKGKKIDGWIGNIGQIEEVKKAVKKRRIDALIISVGVNDVGFTGSLESLMSGDILSWGDTSNREKVIREIKRKIGLLQGRRGLYKKLNDEILKELNVGQVYITEYPTGIFDKMKSGQAVPSGGCGIFASNLDLDITPRDAKDMKECGEELNEAIRAAANLHSWVYVGGIASKFAGRGYCSGKNRLFIQAEESMLIQGDTKGTMHPNGRGHDIIAEELAKALRKGLRIKTTVPTQPTPKFKGPHTIQQKSSGRFVDAHQNADKDFSLVTRKAQHNDTQRWLLTHLRGDIYTIQQRSSRRFVDAHQNKDHDFSLVTRKAQHNDTQRWVIKPL